MSWNLWASWIPNFERCVYASIGQRSFLTILGHINKSNSRCNGLIDFREWFYINKHPSWQIILKSSAESCLLFKNPMDRYLKSGCNTAGPKLRRGGGSTGCPSEDALKRKVSQMPRVDLYGAGLPCQPVSMAGKKRGSVSGLDDVWLCIDLTTPNSWVFISIDEVFIYLLLCLRQILEQSATGQLLITSRGRSQQQFY